MAWRRPKLDLSELAKHRWVLKWSISKLASHFNRAPDTITMHLCALRKSGQWKHFKLSKVELATIKSNINARYVGKD